MSDPLVVLVETDSETGVGIIHSNRPPDLSSSDDRKIVAAALMDAAESGWLRLTSAGRVPEPVIPPSPGMHDAGDDAKHNHFGGDLLISMLSACAFFGVMIWLLYLSMFTGTVVSLFMAASLLWWSITVFFSVWYGLENRRKRRMQQHRRKGEKNDGI